MLASGNMHISYPPQHVSNVFMMYVNDKRWPQCWQGWLTVRPDSCVNIFTADLCLVGCFLTFHNDCHLKTCPLHFLPASILYKRDTPRWRFGRNNSLPLFCISSSGQTARLLLDKCHLIIRLHNHPISMQLNWAENSLLFPWQEQQPFVRGLL